MENLVISNHLIIQLVKCDLCIWLFKIVVKTCFVLSRITAWVCSISLNLDIRMQNYGNQSLMASCDITSSYSSIFLCLLLTCPVHPYHAESLASGESLASCAKLSVLLIRRTGWFDFPSPIRCSAVGNIFFRQWPQKCKIAGYVSPKWEYLCSLLKPCWNVTTVSHPSSQTDTLPLTYQETFTILFPVIQWIGLL